jgi:hypothetical protein
LASFFYLENQAALDNHSMGARRKSCRQSTSEYFASLQGEKEDSKNKTAGQATCPPESFQVPILTFSKLLCGAFQHASCIVCDQQVFRHAGETLCREALRDFFVH